MPLTFFLRSCFAVSSSLALCCIAPVSLSSASVTVPWSSHSQSPDNEVPANLVDWTASLNAVVINTGTTLILPNLTLAAGSSSYATSRSLAFTPAPAPEPQTGILLALGAAFAGARRRRSRIRF
jgi:hypothetical protein